MKRTTIFLDEQIERELQALARRRGRPMAAIVREAIERYVVEGEPGPSRLGFIGVGRSGRTDVAERHEDLLWENEGPSSTGRRAKRKRSGALPTGRGRKG